jgi:type I restriction enzyme R subunit
MRIAATLETKDSIPAVAQQMELIQAVQDDAWWTDVTHAMLEEVRLGLRHLVPLIERTSNNPVYSDFTDEEGDAVKIELPGTGGAVGSTEFRQFRKKAEHFLKEHLAEDAVAKVRSGQPLTPADMEDLQRILVAAGIGDDATFAEASERAGNLGSFVRRLVGLEREAAKAAFADFLDDKRYSRAQIDFVNLIIDELTRHGEITPARIYESPYTGMAPEGPEAIFTNDDLDRLFATIESFANRKTTT